MNFAALLEGAQHRNMHYARLLYKRHPMSWSRIITLELLGNRRQLRSLKTSNSSLLLPQGLCDLVDEADHETTSCLPSSILSISDTKRSNVKP